MPDPLHAATWSTVAAALATEWRDSAAERDARGGRPTKQIEQLRASGLLTLLTPVEYGGAAETWELAMKLVREIARADGSLAHLLGYHYHFSEILRFSGTEEQRARNLRQGAAERWVWGGAVNPRDPDVLLRADGDAFRISGRRTFCSGAAVADRLIVAAKREDTGQSVYASVPARRQGIVINDDWDAFGQRQAVSGSVVFEAAEVYPDELVVRDDIQAGTLYPFGTLMIPALQLVFVNLYVGIAIGALEEARRYTQTITRPWLTSGVDAARRDPAILEQYGTLYADLAAAEALADLAGSAVQAAYNRGEQLTARERGEAAVAVTTAKIVADRVGLAVTSAMFEVMGARATTGKQGLDRYWRNIRTHTLHDPILYKRRELGDFYLNDVIPEPTAYS